MANTPHHKTPPKQISVSSLLSPPEMKRSESFGSSATPSIATTSFSSFNTEQQSRPAMAPWLPETPLFNRDATLTYASPPISPYNSQSQKEDMVRMDVDDERDPQLFGRADAASSLAADEPLFPQEKVDAATQDMITKHMNSINFAALKSKPARADYELAVSLVSNVHELYNKSPRAWFLQEREFDRQISEMSRKNGVHKRQPARKLAPAPSARSGTKAKIALPRLPRSIRVPRAPKRTPTTQVHDSFDNASPSSASPKPSRPAGTRDDTDYRALPDFCPPTSTLGAGNTNALKTEWKGSALKLHDDPDRHLLHEAEIPLAGTLRLTCATYLCSKRRIFAARIEALKIGKEFRKTDAQQACKIDVNKASKLWSVYDKVGWFDPKYFAQYL